MNQLFAAMKSIRRSALASAALALCLLICTVSQAHASFFGTAGSPGAVTNVPASNPGALPPSAGGQSGQGSFFGNSGTSAGSGTQIPGTSYASITTYAQCVAAGFPVMQTVPAQCRVPDGRTITAPQSAPQPQSGSFFSSAGTGFFGQNTQSPLPTVPSSVKIVAYGDSVVRGVGASAGNDFVSLLSQRTGVPIVNAGISGATSAYALQNIDTAVLSGHPDIVILFIGGNDILQNLPASALFSNIQAMVGRIQASGASVILLGIHGPVFRVDYETRYREIAAQTGAYYVPGVMEDIVGRVFLTVDYIHPNNQGYKIIADRVEPTLRLAIQNKNSAPGGNTPLPVTCAANPAEVQTGEIVTWTASFPGSGTASYSWSGDENLQAYSQSVRAAYGSPGTKTARVDVASGTSAGTAQCSVRVVAPAPEACTPASNGGIVSFFSRFFVVGSSGSCI